MKRISIGILLAAIALGGGLVAFAQSTGTANVEIRVWEDVNDASTNYISARPEGGSWQTLGTIPIPLDGVSNSGRFRYGDITLGVPIPGGEAEPPPPSPSRDIEISNLRCGIYSSYSERRSLSGTIRNVSTSSLSDIWIYGSLQLDASTGLVRGSNFTSDVIPPGSTWNFEMTFNSTIGDLCYLNSIEYEKTLTFPATSGDTDFNLSKEYCFLAETSSGVGTWHFITLDNTSGATIDDISVYVSARGANGFSSESGSDSYLPLLVAGGFTVATILMDEFEADLDSCVIERMQYKKYVPLFGYADMDGGTQVFP